MKTIAIIFGAVSYEHEISIVSAIAMKKVLKNNLIYIFIDKNRDLYEIPSNEIKSNLFSSGKYKTYPKLYFTQGGFEKKAIFGNKKIDFDIVLNLTHGADGEDGVLASIFEFFNINFIGPRVEACSVSCNKYFTKMYANEIGVKTIDYKYFKQDDDIKISSCPVIIKPITPQ